VRIFFAILAALCVLLALAGFAGNVKFMKQGGGMPTEPGARQGFIVGMFAAPTALLVGGVTFGVLARRKGGR
jgi:hypothetical protein